MNSRPCGCLSRGMDTLEKSVSRASLWFGIFVIERYDEFVDINLRCAAVASMNHAIMDNTVEYPCIH